MYRTDHGSGTTTNQHSTSNSAVPSSPSAMATLLHQQQNNCMKSLAGNGAGSGNGTPSASAGGAGGGGNGAGVSNGGSDGVSDPLKAAQSSRPLLPHEMAGMTTQAPLPHHHSGHFAYNNNFGFYNSHHHHPLHTGAAGLLPHQQLHSSSAAVASSVASATTTSASANNYLPHHQHHHSDAATVSDRLSPNSCHSTSNDAHALNGVDVKDAPAADAAAAAAAAEAEAEPEPEIDIVINNVVCSFSVRCHLNLREIALSGINVEFRRENGMVTMKLRRPYTTASIWSSGRITCTGATSEDQAKIAARRYARCLQKLGFNVKFRHFRVVNVLGTCSMPWAIKIVNFSEKYKKDASYEPELHPGVTYKLRWPKATLKIFSTGSITVTANSVENVQKAIEHIFPLVYEFRKKRAADDPKLLKQQALAAAAAAADLARVTGALDDPIETKSSTLAAEEIPIDDDEGEDDEADGNTTTVIVTGKNKKPTKLKRKDPFGHASNDPSEDNMYVSDVDMDDDDEDDEVEPLIGDDDDDEDGAL